MSSLNSTSKRTYLSSLVTAEDKEAIGISVEENGPVVTARIEVRESITFPDGTTQTSAGVALPSTVDGGTF